MRRDSIPASSALALTSLTALAACAPGADADAIPVVLREHPSVPRAALSFEGERRLDRVTQLTFNGRVSSASFDLDASQIVFSDVRDGRRCPQVFVMDVDGRNARLASTGGGLALDPHFMPRTERVAFASTRAAGESCPSFLGSGRHLPVSSDLFTSGLDGQATRALISSPGFDGDLTLGLKGDTLVFASTRSGDLELHASRVGDPAAATRLTNHPGYDAEPTLSPDESFLVWVQGEPPSDPGAFSAAVAKGASPTSRTRLAGLELGGADTTTPLTGWSDVSSPRFDATGQHVLFSSRLDDATRARDIYVLRNARQGDRSIERVTFHPADDVAAAMSADGRRLVFASSRNASHPDELNLFVADWVPAPRGPEASLRGQAKIEPATLTSRTTHLSSVDVPLNLAPDAAEPVNVFGYRGLGSPALTATESRFEEQLRIAGARPAPPRDSLSVPYRYEQAITAPPVVEAAQNADLTPSKDEVAPETDAPTPPATLVLSGSHQLGYLAAGADGPSAESIVLIVRLDDPNGPPTDEADPLAPAYAPSVVVEVVEALAATTRTRDVYVLGYVPSPGSDAPPAEIVEELLGASLTAAIHVDASWTRTASAHGVRSGWTLPDALRRAQSGLATPLELTAPDSIIPGGSLDTFHSRHVPALRLWLPSSADATALLFRLALDLATTPHAATFTPPLQATIRQRAARDARLVTEPSPARSPDEADR